MYINMPSDSIKSFVWKWLIYIYQVFIVIIMACNVVDEVRYPIPQLKIKRIIGASYHLLFLLAWFCFGKKECLNAVFVIAVLICMLKCLLSPTYDKQEQQFVQDRLNRLAEEQQKKAAQPKQVYNAPVKDDFELTDDNIMEYLMIKELDKRFR